MKKVTYADISNRMYCSEEYQSIIYRCPACGGIVGFTYDAFTPSLLEDFRKELFIESNIHNVWECMMCHRIWGIGTVRPVFMIGV